MKKTLTIFLVLCSVSSFCYASSFFSVWDFFKNDSFSSYCDTEGHWAKEKIDFLSENEILTGEKVRGNYYFYPEKNITRGEFITYISEILSLPETDEKVTFKDENSVLKTHLIHARRAYSAKIISGSAEADGIYLFSDDLLTRCEAFNIICNILPKKTLITPQPNFADRFYISDAELNSISRLVSEGFISGYSDGTIRPYSKLTRGEAASLIYHLVNQLYDF